MPKQQGVALLVLILSLWGARPCEAQKLPPLPPQGPLVPRLDIPPREMPKVPPAILKRIQSIRPGMTRAQLSKVFTPVQLSADDRWLYIYPKTVTPKGTILKCLVLVKVSFMPHRHLPRNIFDDGLDAEEHAPGGRPDDVIATISQPFVDTTVGPIRID